VEPRVVETVDSVAEVVGLDDIEGVVHILYLRLVKSRCWNLQRGVVLLRYVVAGGGGVELLAATVVVVQIPIIVGGGAPGLIVGWRILRWCIC